MKAFLAGTITAALVAFSSYAVQAAELVDRTGIILLPIACPKTCKFPAHSTPQCQLLSPCAFECKDGYSAFPLLIPDKCVCNWPHVECNGKCGLVKACPSKAHTRRDLPATEANCPVGHTACGILGRSTGSWECVNTQKDLESCGGCLVSTTNELDAREGQDCTAIEGVSDVSCMQGRCVVRKCMPGYKVDVESAACKAIEREKSSANNVFQIAEGILAAAL